MKRILISLAVIVTAIGSALEGSTPLPELERQGTGPVTMLMVPCMSCRWRSFDTFLSRNESRYTMYAVTLPGYGGTPVPDLPMNTDGTPWRDNALDALVNLVEDEDLRDVVLVGHSWGTMVSVQLAARLPDRIAKLIIVDGSIVSPWVASSLEARRKEASGIVQDWGTKLADAEEWRRFNGGRDTLGPSERPPTMEPHRSVLYHGMFMATDRRALLQYWRENVLIDLSSVARRLEIPILDIKALRGDDMEAKRRQHLESLEAERVPKSVKSVFLYDTSHFVMEHRPELFDQIVADFVSGRDVHDFRPEAPAMEP